MEDLRARKMDCRKRLRKVRDELGVNKRHRASSPSRVPAPSAITSPAFTASPSFTQGTWFRQVRSFSPSNLRRRNSRSPAGSV